MERLTPQLGTAPEGGVLSQQTGNALLSGQGGREAFLLHQGLDTPAFPLLQLGIHCRNGAGEEVGRRGDRSSARGLWVSFTPESGAKKFKSKKGGQWCSHSPRLGTVCLNVERGALAENPLGAVTTCSGPGKDPESSSVAAAFFARLRQTPGTEEPPEDPGAQEELALARSPRARMVGGRVGSEAHEPVMVLGSHRESCS